MIRILRRDLYYNHQLSYLLDHPLPCHAHDFRLFPPTTTFHFLCFWEQWKSNSCTDTTNTPWSSCQYILFCFWCHSNIESAGRLLLSGLWSVTTGVTYFPASWSVLPARSINTRSAQGNDNLIFEFSARKRRVRIPRRDLYYNHQLSGLLDRSLTFLVPCS